ncbi:MAG TPA: isoprenylcysteine carboxylmethyltransferase family protein [Candidatus Xenobia bacterium]|nr:isoprenylcysteine carboxylmethyltransferase family protein [Candidatus Xenobia bacterium]
MDPKSLLRVCLQTVFVFAVAFTGWGWDDLPGFFAHPARAGLVGVALLSLLLVVALRIPLAMLRKGSRPVGRQRWALASLFLLVLTLMFLLAYGDRRDWLTFDAPDGLRYLAVAVYFAGNVIAFTAVKTLGRQYSGYVTLQENHQLIQSGIYGLIRHPIYLRMLLVGVSVPVIFRSWLWVPFFLSVLGFVACRIRSEEKLLAQQFGGEFETYRRRTWRLIPYLY